MTLTASPNFTPARFGRNIRLFRERRGLSRLALAARIGCSYRAVEQWERGDCLPYLDNGYRLALALGVTVEWLVEGR